MKNRLSTLIVIAFVIGVLYVLKEMSLADRSVGVTPLPTSESPVLGTESNEALNISHNGRSYRVFSLRVHNDQDVTLIPNFKELKTSSDIKAENMCESLVNAGFYTLESTPVGYFETNEKIIRNIKESTLFDGFITQNTLRTRRITRTLPRDPLIFGVQVGPFLWENGKPIKLTMRNDKYARRVVAVVTSSNELWFLALVSESDFSGPLMVELPTLVRLWGEKTNVLVADAINLDGGSASAFKTSTVNLSEVSPIGAAFCIKIEASL